MHVALEAGQVDLFSRAKYLSKEQAADIVAAGQGDSIKQDLE